MTADVRLPIDGNVRVRVAHEEDAEALCAIYAPYVEETAITFEYEVPSVGEFAGRIGQFGATYPFLLAERVDGEGREVLGYAYAHPYYGRAAYAWCAEVSIYLRRDARGLGVGTRLYAALERALKEMGVLKLYACVVVAADGDPYVPPTSVAFHEARGYRAIGRFTDCGYKFGRWYDTVWMEKALGRCDAAPPAVVPFCNLGTVSL